MIGLNCIFLVLVFIFVTCHAVPSAQIRGVAVFANKDTNLHKYAAILAASEPFLNQRNEEIKSILNPVVFWFFKASGTAFSDPSSRLRQRNELVNAACEQYEKRTSEIVRGYGLPVSTFNDMSMDIDEQPKLKKRVLMQAYFYKIAADLEANVRPVLPRLPDISKGAQPVMQEGDYTGLGARATEPEDRRFAKAIGAVEKERMRMRAELMSELNVDYLPRDMCDPGVMPAMSKGVQRACTNFPRVAVNKAEDYGIEADRFFELKDRMARNPLYRLKLDQEIARMKREQARADKAARRAAAAAGDTDEA